MNCAFELGTRNGSLLEVAVDLIESEKISKFSLQ